MPLPKATNMSASGYSSAVFVIADRFSRCRDSFNVSDIRYLFVDLSADKLNIAKPSYPPFSVNFITLSIVLSG